MRKYLCLVFPLASFITISSAQTVTTQTFGSGSNAFSMDFVEIGNPGNAPDTTGNADFPPVRLAGSVAYTYKIGKYEVSRDMIIKASAAGVTGLRLADFTYSSWNSPTIAASGIGWVEAAKFVNYLNTISGSSPAYKIDSSGNFLLWSAGEVGYNANNKFRNTLAKYFIPSVDEWYKAAFGSPNNTWYDYPTGSDSAPVAINNGTSVNTAVYDGDIGTGIADIAKAGGLSAWGTMGQGGNVWEWTETAYDGINDSWSEWHEVLGGAYDHALVWLNSSSRTGLGSTGDGSSNLGFRVATLAEITNQVTTNQVTTNTYTLVMQKSSDLQSWSSISTNIISDTNVKAFFRIQIQKQ